MKLSVALLSLAFVAGGAFAADGNKMADAPKAKKEASPAQKAQRERMKTCNAEAKSKGKAGDERKAFMKECLSGGPSVASGPSPAGCEAQADQKKLAGASRNSFIKKCQVPAAVAN